jgi:hypothetical protein
MPQAAQRFLQTRVLPPRKAQPVPGDATRHRNGRCLPVALAVLIAIAVSALVGHTVWQAGGNPVDPAYTLWAGLLLSLLLVLPLIAIGNSLHKSATMRIKFLVSLSTLGAYSLNAFGESALVTSVLQLTTTQFADQARISFIRQSMPYDTTSAMTNGLGGIQFQLLLDDAVSVDDPARGVLPRSLAAGMEPAGDVHHVYSSDTRVVRDPGTAAAAVYNLLGQRIDGLEFIGLDGTGIAVFQWAGASRFSDGVYFATVNGATTELLNLGSAANSVPWISDALRNQLLGTPGSAQGSAVPKGHRTDDWVPTTFDVIIEPTADTDHPFNTVHDEVTVDALDFTYIRTDLVPLSSQSFAGRAIEMTTSGRWSTTQPVGGLDVRFRNDNNQVIASTVTGADGTWFMDVPFTDGNFNVDGSLEITSPAHLSYILYDLHVDYSATTKFLPQDPNGYPGPMNTAMVLRESYMDPLTSELIDLNVYGLKETSHAGLSTMDGNILAMVFRGDTYPIYFNGISEWGVSNFQIRYGDLSTGDIVLNTAQGIFLYDEVLGTVHGRILERVFSPISLPGLNIQSQYNGLLSPQPFRAYEGIMLENTGNNYCETRFRGPPYPHVIMAEQETSSENPAGEESHKELCRSIGLDDVTAYESVMNNNPHHSLINTSEPGARTDRVNFRAIWGVHNVVYADSLATPGVLYHTYDGFTPATGFMNSPNPDPLVK